MLNSKSFSLVINQMEHQDEEFIQLLDKIINFIVFKFKTTEELQEEIVDYDDIYQIIIKDLDFNFWLKISDSSIIYKKGINRNASFRVIYPKEMLVKILKREMIGTDAFMRGIVKVDGDLSQGLRYIKLFRLFLKYLNNGFAK